MTPAPQAEIPYFSEVVRSLRRWADALEQHIAAIPDRGMGPAWSDQDLRQLYEAWLRVGNALRDMTRSRVTADATEARSQVLAVSDGLSRIADIVSRQA